MKSKHVTYWIATIVISAFMVFVAFAYLTRNAKMMTSFASLGYPDYFPAILGVAKLLGVLALLVPGVPHLKEWAYAGFTFTFLGAILSHLASGQTMAALMPLASLLVLAVSYATRPADRRLPMGPEVEHHHPLTGIPIG